MTWKMSDNFQKLIIANEKHWKATAIFYLYSQKNKQENYLWFNPEISEETLTEIRAMQPDSSSKWGAEPENWQSKTPESHAFDLVKYCYLAKDFALQSLQKSRFRFGQAPSILRRFDKQKRREEAKQQSETKNSWFTL